jgi:hypothetical protein
MVDVPDFIDVPIFGVSSSKIEPTPTIYSNGFLPGQVFPAENENWFMNGLTGNGVTEQDSIVSLVTEMVNFLSAYSVSPNPALFNQFLTTFQAQLALKGNLAGPTHFTGVTTIDAVPTPSSGDNPTTKTYVDTNLLSKANLVSPVFTGNPTAPTQSPSNNSTRLATTAYADSAVTAAGQYLYFTSVVLSGGAGNLSGLVPGLVVIKQPNTAKIAVVAFSIDGIVVISNATAMTLTFGNSTSISITGGSGNQTIAARVLAVGP